MDNHCGKCYYFRASANPTERMLMNQLERMVHAENLTEANWSEYRFVTKMAQLYDKGIDENVLKFYEEVYLSAMKEAKKRIKGF